MSAIAPALLLSDSGQTRLIGTVSVVHGVSHYYHLLIAPLFPWLRDEFGFSYAELGLLMTVFFVVSGLGQAAGGFLVDRIGPRPVLIGSLICFVLACLVLASASGYPVLVMGAMLAGLGNAAFHPVDFSILNARIRVERLGRAYAMHGLSGSLGWAVAPLMLTGVAQLAGWRWAFIAGMAPALLALAICAWARTELDVRPAQLRAAHRGGVVQAPLTLGALLRLRPLWFSAFYFFASAIAFGAVQSFGAESMRLLREIDLTWAGYLLSIYMVGSAAGILLGGYLLSDPSRVERFVTRSFIVSAPLALIIGFAPLPSWAVPVLFGLLGIATGTAGPARDLLVKRATPPGASGRVYGLVYSALDVGISVSPALFGLLMDAGLPVLVWVGVSLAYVVLILSANLIGRATRVSATTD
jgi:FSR family fosmidomycin resistance protein-like MFS transporter